MVEVKLQEGVKNVTGFYSLDLEEHGCGQTWSDVLENSRLYEQGRDDPQTVHLMVDKTVKDNQGRTISVEEGLQKAMDVGMIYTHSQSLGHFPIQKDGRKKIAK